MGYHADTVGYVARLLLEQYPHRSIQGIAQKRFAADSNHNWKEDQGKKMKSILRTILKFTVTATGILKLIVVRRNVIEGVVLAKVSEFHIPTSFRKPMKWAPEMQREKLLEFRSHTRKSA